MAAAPGHKLHSIIEKLSEHCVQDDGQIHGASNAGMPNQTTSEDGTTRRNKRKQTEVKKTQKVPRDVSDMKETVLRAHSVIHIIGPLDMTSGQGGLPMQMNIKEPPQQKPTAKNILVKKKPRRKRKKKTVDKETMTSMADLINQKPLPKLFECDICVAKFDNQQDLDGHLEEDHQSEESESSDYDIAAQSSGEELSEPGSDPDFSCGESDLMETSEPEKTTRRLTRNLRKSLLDGSLNDLSPDNDPCVDLKSVLDMPMGLEDIVETTPKISRPQVCQNCSQSFESFAVLKSHRQESKECAAFYAAAKAKRQAKEEEKRVCPFCKKKFDQAKDRNNHFKTNKACQESLKCSTCGWQFFQLRFYQEHMLTHTAERLHKCDKCDAAFLKVSQLTNHMFTHSEVKRFACDQCDRRFSHKGSLVLHRRWVHKDVKAFQCDHCELRFFSQASMKNHSRRHTGDLPFKCHVCGNKFATNQYLRMHLVTHSDAKPFTCEVCGKGFKRKDHLTTHKVIHSEDKPYQCSTCQREFNQYVCLRLHLPCKGLEPKAKRGKNRSGKEKGEEKELGPKAKRGKSGSAGKQTSEEKELGPKAKRAKSRSAGKENSEEKEMGPKAKRGKSGSAGKQTSEEKELGPKAKRAKSRSAGKENSEEKEMGPKAKRGKSRNGKEKNEENEPGPKAKRGKRDKENSEEKELGPKAKRGKNRSAGEENGPEVKSKSGRPRRKGVEYTARAVSAEKVDARRRGKVRADGECQSKREDRSSKRNTETQRRESDRLKSKSLSPMAAGIQARQPSQKRRQVSEDTDLKAPETSTLGDEQHPPNRDVVSPTIGSASPADSHCDILDPLDVQSLYPLSATSNAASSLLFPSSDDILATDLAKEVLSSEGFATIDREVSGDLDLTLGGLDPDPLSTLINTTDLFAPV